MLYIVNKQCLIRNYCMPGAGGIACAVLNFRRLGFSSCAQDTVYVVHSFKVDFGKRRKPSSEARTGQGPQEKTTRADTDTTTIIRGAKSCL